MLVLGQACVSIFELLQLSRADESVSASEQNTGQQSGAALLSVQNA